MRPIRAVTVVTTITCAALLSGCLGAPASSEPASQQPSSTSSPEAADEAAAIPECDGILLAAGEQVAGQQLGDCIVSAMLTAGTGVHRVDASDGTSSIVTTRYAPDFAMSVDGDQQAVLHSDTGWLQVPGSGWVQADPGSSDPAVVMATSIVEVVRAVTDPQVLAASFATSPTWTVVGDEPVPVGDATADVAWKIVPDNSMDVAGVAVTEVGLWLDSDYLGVFYTGTGSYAGHSVTTTNTFLEWGRTVEISDPARE